MNDCYFFYSALCLFMKNKAIAPDIRNIKPEIVRATCKEIASFAQPTKGPTMEKINLPTRFFTDKIVARISEVTSPFI